MNLQKSAIILAALRHLQGDMMAGRDISYLNEVVNIDMTAIDPEELNPLCEEVNCPDSDMYQVITMSTGHLTADDIRVLEEQVNDEDNMVMMRGTGFFIKLYEGENTSNYRHGHSESIKEIIRWAITEGYRMIEFDCDADFLEQFPTFEH